jgi:endoglucanase
MKKLCVLLLMVSVVFLASCPEDPDGSGNNGQKTLSSIAVTTLPNKVVYNLNEMFESAGMVVTATYSDKSTTTLTSGFTLSTLTDFTPTTAGVKTIRVTYQGKTTTFQVEVISTWNGWLAAKYNKTFGYDAENGLGGLKETITHNMLAEEYFFAKGLNAGWNLANTYDLNSNPRANDANGNYDKVMAGIKAAGINVIRMPVTWNSNSSGSGADTVINSAWLDNVEAAVTAAHTAGLVVFINTHHDKSFFNLNQAGESLIANPDGTGADFVAYTERFKAVWGQIAERFKDYGGWLLFEALNEPTITVGGVTNWDGAPPTYHEVLNRWCQAFVDTVRETGGNNAKRYLIFKSYAGKLQTSLNLANNFRVPTDPAGTGRLVYSFHSYVPQPLGLEGTGTDWGTTHANQYISAFAQAADKYIKKGIPVFMGETGATFHSQRTGEDSITANKNRLLMLNAMGFYARSYGVIPCLWDNGDATHSGGNQPNGETFAMFRRKAAHDNDTNNWGKPIDHTKVAGGSAVDSTGGVAMVAGNAAREDPDFGEYTMKAFIDAINGRKSLGNPDLTPKLIELGVTIP